MSRSRARVLLVVAAVGLVGAFGASSAEAAEADPTCADVKGVTYATSDRWRIVALPRRKGEWEYRVVACRLADAPPILVRQLGTTANPGLITGGPFLTFQLAGDLAIRWSRVSSSSGSNSAGTLLDLAAGRSMPLGTDRLSQLSDTQETVLATFAPDGTFATTRWEQPCCAPLGKGGALRLFDAIGEHVGQTVSGLQASRGDGTPAGGGFYLISADGSIARIPSAGAPAAGTLGATDRKIRLRRISLTRAGAPHGYRLVDLPGGSEDVSAQLLVRRATGATTLLVREPMVAQRWAKAKGVALVPGSAGETKVLSYGNGDTMAIIARYADAPRELRLRTLAIGDGTPHARVDIPVPAGAEQPGRAIIGDCGWFAVADGDRLRIWDPKERSVAIPGVHDLTEGGPYGPGSSCEGFIATNGAGEPIGIPALDLG